MKSLNKLLEHRNYVAHNIRLADKTGHVITKVIINGHSGRFIIDTGASATCIDNTLTDRFSLDPKEMSERISTASGSLTPQISHHNHVQLGDYHDTDCDLLVMDMSYINQTLKNGGMYSVQGILGANFLHKSRAIIDYGSLTIYLKC